MDFRLYINSFVKIRSTLTTSETKYIKNRFYIKTIPLQIILEDVIHFEFSFENRTLHSQMEKKFKFSIFLLPLLTDIKDWSFL